MEIAQPTEPEDFISTQFFKLPANASTELKGIADKLKAQAEEKKLSSLIKWAGYPRWDKIKIVEEGEAKVGRANGSNGQKLYYIPFVKDSSNKVGAILEVKFRGTDTLFKMIYSRQYRSYGFDTTDAIKWNARNIFQLFTLFDNYVFGHTKFLIKDKELFPKKGDSAQLYLTLVKTKSNGATGSSRISQTAIEYCVTYRVCVKNTVAYARIASSDGCSETFFIDVCTTYFSGGGSGSGGTGGGTSGGGTGGGGGSDGGPFDEPCTPGPPIMRSNATMTTACGEEGWEPVVDDVLIDTSDPCITAQTAAKKMDSLYLNSKVDSVLATIPNLAIEPNEKGFPIIKKFKINPYDVTDTTTTGYYSGAVHTGTPTGISYTFYIGGLEVPAGALHTHPPNGGYTAHSAVDVYELINQSTQNSHYEGAFVKAANGSEYALTVTNYSKAAAFFYTKGQNLNTATSNWNEESEIGKAFRDAYDYFETKRFKNDPNKRNLAYEMAMAAVLNKYDIGLTLNKKDASGNFKPIVVKASPDPRRPRRIIYTRECL